MLEEAGNQNIIINYNPNSFFYTSAQAFGDLSYNTMDAINDCKTFFDDNENVNFKNDCKNDNFPINKDKCLKKASCENLIRASELYNKKNEYSSSGQLYLDNSQNYKKKMITSVNLTVGSVFLVYVIMNKVFQ